MYYVHWHTLTIQTAPKIRSTSLQYIKYVLKVSVYWVYKIYFYSTYFQSTVSVSDEITFGSLLSDCNGKSWESANKQIYSFNAQRSSLCTWPEKWILTNTHRFVSKPKNRSQQWSSSEPLRWLIRHWIQFRFRSVSFCLPRCLAPASVITVEYTLQAVERTIIHSIITIQSTSFYETGKLP